MGIWSKLFGGAEGIREAMLEAYSHHFRLATQAPPPNGDGPHEFALYQALGSRYMVTQKPAHEAALYAELLPFYVMDAHEAPSLLAEYIVFQERPQDAQVDRLCSILNESVNSIIQGTEGAEAFVRRAGADLEALRYTLLMGFANGVAWSSLIEVRLRHVLAYAQADAGVAGALADSVTSATGLGVRKIADMLQSPSKGARIMALHAIRRMGKGSHGFEAYNLGSALGRLLAKDPSSHVRSLAADAHLANVYGGVVAWRREVEQSIDSVRHSDAPGPWMLAIMLFMVGGVAAKPLLAQISEDDSPRIRLLAQRCMENLQGLPPPTEL